MFQPKHITNQIIHCSDSNWGDVDEVRSWHLARGFRDIGYHWVILNGKPKSNGKYYPEMDGLIQAGRSIDNNTLITENEVGAHALGFNDCSEGICWIGGYNGINNITPKQYKSLLILSIIRKIQISAIEILGHRETPQGAHKLCPVINMDEYRKRVDNFIKLDNLLEILDKLSNEKNIEIPLTDLKNDNPMLFTLNMNNPNNPNDIAEGCLEQNNDRYNA
jgi:hypothetical protein